MIRHRPRPVWSLLLSAALLWMLVPAPAGAVHGPAEVSVHDAAGPEGDEGLSFDVRAEPALGLLHEPISISYRTEEATEGDPATGGSCADGADYVPRSGAVTITPLDAPDYTTTIDVTVCGDDAPEHHETFDVVIESDDANITRSRAVGTIHNDDAPELTVSDGVAVEGETTTFFLRLSHPNVNRVSVHVTTRDGTATAGQDYQPFDDTVTIDDPTAVEHAVRIATTDDDRTEGDETFFVDLSDPRNATLVRATGEGLIIEGDIAIDAGADVTAESATATTFTARVSGGSENVTVTWDFGDGSPTRTGAVVEHRFDESGTYTVTVTVEDNATGATASDTATATITDSGQVGRSAGSDRIATAIDVSRDHWDRADTVLLATGYNYPDALAAGPLANVLDAPLLLTHPDGLPGEVLEELDRLDARTVIVLGGPQAVPQDQADALAAAGYVVRRVAGTTRFGTAASLATAVGPTADREVTVALGAHPDPDRDEWPDALSAGSFAASEDPLPSLLTHHEFVPDETLAALEDLDTEAVFLLGGPVAISPRVQDELERAGYTVRRVAGDDRFGTSVAAATITMERHPGGQVHPVLATGLKFPDGLTGGALAAELVGPVLLVPHDDLAAAAVVRAFLREQAERFDLGTAVGGEAVISERVRQQARSDIQAT